MSIRKYLEKVFSDGYFFYYKYEAKRTKDCSSAAGGHRKRVNECGGWSAVSAELRKAWFLRQQKCAQNKTSKIARIETVTKAKSETPR